MSASPEAAPNRLQKIRETFLHQLPTRLEELEGAWEVCAHPGAAREAQEHLFRLLHSLKGTSASFGLGTLSREAAEGERLAKEAMEAGGAPAVDWRPRMQACLSRIGEAMGQVETAPVSSRSAPQVSAPRPGSREGRRKRVFLCETDPSLRQSLSDQMRCFGFEVEAFEELETARQALRAMPPDALVMDVLFPGLALDAPEVVELTLRGSLPMVFTAQRSDLALRLSAVRAGSSAFMVKPVNTTELCSALAKLMSVETPEPYRVLVVDDDPSLAAYHAQILEDAGMETRILTDPLQTLGPLVEMRPDLILMDMYMPGCDGMELAKTIRQMGAHFSIPIVFLSSETDEDKQFTAMRTGGDEFLTKPIKAHHLVSAVSVRAERMKILRSQMVRDSMTGLLNHTATRDHLDSAITQARRTGGEVCFAMIDVDKFKSVNDTYGHAIGDRVLIALARMLQQRLRKSDIAGRFGGEEFAVVLPDCELSRAVAIMNDLRENFSTITYETAGTSFRSTFSCGVSALSAHPDAMALCKAADDALYQAKHGGRNRVVTLDGALEAAPS